MDTRHRVYYLVNLNQNYRKGGWWTPGWDSYGFLYDRNMDELKRSIGSLKIRPYGLFNGVCDIIPGYYQLKLSCKKEDEAELVNVLTNMRDVNFKKIHFLKNGGFV